MPILAFMNQKGGVGKTTTVVNLAAALADRGKDILVIDCDPQANATAHLSADLPEGSATIYDVLLSGVPLGDAVANLRDHLWLVPSELDLAGADMELAGHPGRETLLRAALGSHLEERGRYDYVLLDCPPSLGLLPLNALACADEVAVVLQAEFFALQGISGLDQLIQLVAGKLNPGLITSTIVICMLDTRTRFSREVIDDLRTYFGDRLMGTMVRRNVKLAEAASHGVSIFDYDPRCPGARDYDALAEEFLKRRDDQPARRPGRRKRRRLSTRKPTRPTGPAPEPPTRAQPPVSSAARPLVLWSEDELREL